MTLKDFKRIVGTWDISGDARGRITYRWAPGGHFLMQEVDLEYEGKQIKGVEIIGHLHRVREDPSKDIWSRFYSYLDGLTLDYVYELDGDTLTIWFGEKGSDNFFTGTLNPDGTSCTGGWQWPGGGYRVAWKRVS